jgi:hypothetical protein
MSGNEGTLTAVIRGDGAEDVGTILLQPKVYKTGSTGYFGQGKVIDNNGQKYQVQVMLVAVGTKGTR